MINFYCHKVYHTVYDVKRTDLPVEEDGYITFQQCIALLSLLYLKYAELNRDTTENKITSINLYLFHPYTYTFDISKVSKHSDCLSMMHIFKKDEYLSEFTSYYTGDDFMDVRTILLFPIYSDSEKALAQFIVFDILSNYIFIFSPFDTVRLNVFASFNDFTFLSKSEIPIATIIFICKAYNLVRSQRFLNQSSSLEIENDTYHSERRLLKKILKEMTMKHIQLTKDNLDSQVNLGNTKHFLILFVFKRIIKHVCLLGWSAESVDLGDFTNLKESQLNLFKFLSDHVFEVNIKTAKFPKTSVFGLTMGDLKRHRIMMFSAFDNYKNRSSAFKFEILNHHYTRPDINAEVLLWNLLQKHDFFRTRSPSNSSFLNGYSKELIKYMNRWVKNAYLELTASFRIRVNEFLLSRIRSVQLKQLLDYNPANIPVDNESDNSLDEIAFELEEQINIEELNEEEHNNSSESNNVDCIINDNQQIVISDGNSPNVEIIDDMMDQISIHENEIAKEEITPLNVLIARNVAACLNSKLSVEYESFYHVLLDFETRYITKEYHKRLTGKGGKSAKYFSCFEYQFFDNQEFVFKKVKQKYNNYFNMTTITELQTWIQSRCTSFKKMGRIGVLRDGELFKIGNAYFIPFKSILVLCLRTQVWVKDIKNFSILKFWFNLKIVIKIWLLELPENKNQWTDDHHNLWKEKKNEKITKSLVLNIDWFGEFYSLIAPQKNTEINSNSFQIVDAAAIEEMNAEFGGDEEINEDKNMDEEEEKETDNHVTEVTENIRD